MSVCPAPWRWAQSHRRAATASASALRAARSPCSQLVGVRAWEVPRVRRKTTSTRVLAPKGTRSGAEGAPPAHADTAPRGLRGGGGAGSGGAGLSALGVSRTGSSGSTQLCPAVIGYVERGAPPMSPSSAHRPPVDGLFAIPVLPPLLGRGAGLWEASAVSRGRPASRPPGSAHGVAVCCDSPRRPGCRCAVSLVRHPQAAFCLSVIPETWGCSCRGLLVACGHPPRCFGGRGRECHMQLPSPSCMGSPACSPR